LPTIYTFSWGQNSKNNNQNLENKISALSTRAIANSIASNNEKSYNLSIVKHQSKKCDVEKAWKLYFDNLTTWGIAR